MISANKQDEFRIHIVVAKKWWMLRIIVNL